MSGRESGAGLLEARLGDYLARAGRGSVAVSRFLTPGEQKQAARWLEAHGAGLPARFWGGYPGAERRCLFLLPEFYADCGLLPPEDADPGELLPDPADAPAALRVTGSGFCTLTHRDYLGALLGLGLERDVLGDIAVQSPQAAVVFCTGTAAGFLLSSLRKVGADSVGCALCTPGADFTDGRRYSPLSATVASARLDCVVAALTHLSREEAQRAVRTGLVELDFEPEERPDRLLSPPLTLSVRGCGRYVLRAFEGETRRGRLRLRADRLV